MNALQKQTTQPIAARVAEALVTTGDLAGLTPEQRINYYLSLCNSLRLNPTALPFEYISLNGKLVLYAKRNCTDQLRAIHNITVIHHEREIVQKDKDELVIVNITIRDETGRETIDCGVVNTRGKIGEDLANAYMKAHTKALRRATLSHCGLSVLDETEAQMLIAQPHQAQDWNCTPETKKAIQQACKELELAGVDKQELKKCLPEGRTQLQQLTEAEAGLFLSNLQKLK
ncbi:hypothetical protein [Bacteriophage sp.]|nr:hypothetical protein [Bacteriophage sp.]